MRDGIRRSCAAMLALVGSVAASGAYTGAQESGNTEFERIARSFFYAGFAESPSSATANGVHAYDAKIDDVSASATLAHFAREKKTLAAVQAIDPATLSADDALDRTMLLDSIEDDLLVNERAATWRHDPDLYVSIASDAIYGLIERDFAPLSVRLRDTIAREQQLARLFAQARANLATVDAVTKQVASDDAEGAVGFFADDVPNAFTAVHDPALQAALRGSTATAAAATRNFSAYIKRIRPSGTYAIGAAAYRARLRYEDAIDMPLDRYLAFGWAALRTTRAEYIATAKKIDPAKPAPAVFKELEKIHPSPSRLLAAAAQDLVGLRAFLISHRIITLPADADVRVVETPAFERSVISAQMDAPGPLETHATLAYYNVTPADPSWPPARQEGFLEQFNDFERPIISAHEIYPGHFVNFAIDKHLPLSLTRKMLWNSEFGEGWAHYSEQMVVDEGWGNGDPRVRLAQLDEAILRNCRYVVGVELHTAGWSLGRAERFFRDECFQTPAVAIEEATRGTQDPMYGYYTLGKMMILKLRDDYKRKLGSAYTLEKFHDALLAHGDPPVPLVRPFLLGSADDGQPL